MEINYYYYYQKKRKKHVRNVNSIFVLLFTNKYLVNMLNILQTFQLDICILTDGLHFECMYNW